MTQSVIRRGRNGQAVNMGETGRYVDIVYVIDGTGSMQNLLDAVKERALRLYQDILDGMRDKALKVSKMRIKVIVYRDIYVDAHPFEESEFFVLPDQQEEFHAFVRSIRAKGGGDTPESGLEALYRAIHSDFTPMYGTSGRKGRQIIVVMTDAPAHALNDLRRNEDPLYPRDMPHSLAELENDYMDCLDGAARRLIVFAPNDTPWPTIGGWSNANIDPIRPGGGIDASVYQVIVAAISGSLS